MKINNTRDGMDGLSGRHFVMRDVRFAGTVAAGLVAGVLGVGALTAPLLGWTEWPSSPPRGEHGGTVTLRDKATTTNVSRSGASTGRSGSSATAPVVVAAVGLPGVGVGVGPSGTVRLTVGSRGGGGGSSAGGGGTRSAGRGDRTPVLRGGAGSQRAGSPASGFGTAGFQTADSDGDGMPDFYERAYELNPNNPADGGMDNDGDGISNANEFKLRSTRPDLGNPNSADSNNDGVADYEDAAAAGVVETPPAVEAPPVVETPPVDPTAPPTDTPPDDGTGSGGDTPVGTTPDPVEVEDPTDDGGTPDDGQGSPDEPAPAPAPTTDPTPAPEDPAPAPDPAPTTDPTPAPETAPCKGSNSPQEFRRLCVGEWNLRLSSYRLSELSLVDRVGPSPTTKTFLTKRI